MSRATYNVIPLQELFLVGEEVHSQDLLSHPHDYSSKAE